MCTTTTGTSEVEAVDRLSKHGETKRDHHSPGTSRLGKASFIATTESDHAWVSREAEVWTLLEGILERRGRVTQPAGDPFKDMGWRNCRICSVDCLWDSFNVACKQLRCFKTRAWLSGGHSGGDGERLVQLGIASSHFKQRGHCLSFGLHLGCQELRKGSAKDPVITYPTKHVAWRGDPAARDIVLGADHCRDRGGQGLQSLIWWTAYVCQQLPRDGCSACCRRHNIEYRINSHIPFMPTT